MSGLLTPGQTFAERYEVVRMLSRGGMGAVYEVVHRETNRRRALKVMLPSLVDDPEMRGRFLREARVTAAIESENLVETFDAGIDPETRQPFLVMEMLRGSDLETTLLEGPLHWEKVVAILSQVARGLDKTHAAGVVHRDLKPENIFVTKREDGSDLVKLLDFGIAKVVNDSAYKTTRALGTPLYMAPEVLERTRDGMSGAIDRYALGHIAYTLLVGEAYFETECRESDSLIATLPLIARGAVTRATVRARDHGMRLPIAFDGWFERATHRAPAERFDTAREQIEALGELLRREPPGRLEPHVGAQRLASPDAETLAVGVPPITSANSRTPAPSIDDALIDPGSSGAPSSTAHPPPTGTRDFTVEVDSTPRAPTRVPLLVGAAAALIGVVALALWSGVGRTTTPALPPSAEVGEEAVASPPSFKSPPTVDPTTSFNVTQRNPSASASGNETPSSPASSVRPAARAKPSVRVPASAPPTSECDRDPSRCR